MSEHARTVDSFTGEVWQWVDEDQYTILDTITGEPARLFDRGDAVGTWADALQVAAKLSRRYVIVKLQTVVAHKVES